MAMVSGISCTALSSPVSLRVEVITSSSARTGWSVLEFSAGLTPDDSKREAGLGKGTEDLLTRPPSGGTYTALRGGPVPWGQLKLSTAKSIPPHPEHDWVMSESRS